MQNLQNIIEKAWDEREKIDFPEARDIKLAVKEALSRLDKGELRVAEKKNGAWTVNQWAKKAILLSFRINQNKLMGGAPTVLSKNTWLKHFAYGGAFGKRKKVGDEIKLVDYSTWYDKVDPKFLGWGETQFKAAGFRAVPGCFVRHSAHIAKDAVLMPSFVNVGAYVGEGTMVDTWATIGSCAQIGRKCHISGGTGIGGVLEPLQAGPVIIEDNCFIGARSEIAEGVIVEEGAVISMGVFIGASTKIIDRETGEVIYGRVPAYSVVVPGSLPGKTPDSPSLYAAVIVKKVDEKTRSKTSINELLRA